MLQRLEGADGLAELAARLEVFDGLLTGGVHRACRLGQPRRDGEVDGALQQVEASVDRADHPRFRNLHAGERQRGVVPVIHRPESVDLQAGRIPRHEEERDARPLPGLA